MTPKNFDNWNNLKKQIHTDRTAPEFNAREVWWCSFGANVGHEQDGKNTPFERPALIIRKYNKELFYGLPLTTVVKDNRFHFPLTNKKTRGSVILSQGRILSAKRLNRKMYDLDTDVCIEIIERHNALLTSEKALQKAKSPDKLEKSRWGSPRLHDKYIKSQTRIQKSKSPHGAGKSRMASANLYDQYIKPQAKSQASTASTGAKTTKRGRK